ncbi:hypothetical protein [Halalkalibacter akibai]|uniref:Uncharacterized protein n=1 Tax=Halalkalibacter akibai (strain ATCC 43226 / DSM 21942 / CIP 109018 / JCM 9157 / 1139) TaxID=1236973 RepID=W4QNG1_HALA3|nr:hypothetical protein [Halalkalibacter akibai]GAE33412.1 hypothetical protein JCM9157_411 [Halalkalibacter akibai JCM 9157]
MDKQRKEIILKEIKYWKETKLLPEKYCDFLITLYTEGDQADNESSIKKNSPLQAILIFLCIQAMFLLAILVIYFTDFSIVLQMGIVVFIAMTIIIIARKTSNELLFSLYCMNAAFIIFLLTIHIVLLFANNSTVSLIVAILAHCLVWFYIGWKWSIRFFTIAAVLTLLFLVIFLLR